MNTTTDPIKEKEDYDITKLQPWNSGDYPLEIYSVRSNQDSSLLSLGTSRGYKIFLSKTLRSVSEYTDQIRELGPLLIVMTYLKSPLVFFLPHKTNQNYRPNELIVFDDSEQKKISSFKLKNDEDEILDFSVGRSEIFVITVKNIIILEILSFNVLSIIDNINPNNKLISYNFYDFIAYTKLNDNDNNKGKNAFVTFYNNKDHKCIYRFNRIIKSRFDQIQCLCISPTGNIVAVANSSGNKIHFYYTNKSRLKECLYLGSSSNKIEKILFSTKKENYLLVLKKILDTKINKNKKIFSVYKLEKNFVENPVCYCEKYDDNGNLKEAFKDKNKAKKEGRGFFGLFKKAPKNLDIKEQHASGEIKGDLKGNGGIIGEDNYIGFDGEKNKGIVIINKTGYYYKYLLKKNKEQGIILPKEMLKWA